MIRWLSGGPDPVAVVGAKAASLQVLRAAGFDVSDGFALSVEFFAPWMEEVRASPAWRAFAVATGAQRLAACGAVRDLAAALALPADRAAALGEAMARLDGASFAVRSSSPEEDLEGSSFAGAYTTALGVRRADVSQAIARVFASCFDARVASYKEQRGLPVLEPSIAVVVQRQIASEVAGVAFTADPIDGDQDHVVISANHGLGESVVSGTASPDQWTVDRATGAILGRQAGAKETAVFLGDEGGTVERTPAQGPCLLDDGVALVARAALSVEAAVGRPVDVEWAWAGGVLHLLQARPITTTLDLPDDLRTAPGERRRLYWDVTISMQGTLRPMSPLGTDALRRTLAGALSVVAGRGAFDRAESPVLVRHGRMLMALSNVFAVADPARMGPAVAHNIDPDAGRAIAAADRARYASPPGVEVFRFRFVRFIATRLAPLLLAALLAPARARRSAFEAVARRRASLARADLPAMPQELVDAGRALFREVLPRFAASRVAVALLQKLTSPEEAAALDRALPHNVTVEMGLALSRMAALVPPGLDAAALGTALSGRTAPAALQAAWDEFLARNGHRGPLEIDAARPRYREEPRLLLEQLVTMRDVPAAERPDATHRSAQDARIRARDALLARLGPVRRRFVRHLAAVVEELGGLRELPKYLIVSAIDRARDHALARGQQWGLGAGVFDVLLDDLGGDRPPDALRAARRAGADRLARCPDLPRVFDSRGRVLRPPPGPGGLVGLAVSPGVARGRVAVLHRPDERPLRPGEILVARATDPGWTPLFATAVAVVLEVGGVLQHGALVAREYGRPCVTGIENATRLLRDGEEIEVDGTAGVIRRLGDDAR